MVWSSRHPQGVTLHQDWERFRGIHQSGSFGSGLAMGVRLALRVFVISERRVLRRGLAIRLGLSEGVEAIGVGGRMRWIERMVGDGVVDWFVVDADLCETDSFGLIRELRFGWPAARFVLLLSELRDVAIARGLIAGVDAMVTVHDSARVLGDVLLQERGVNFGSGGVSRRVERGLVSVLRNGTRWGALPLSMRECEVVTYLASGLSLGETAERMGLSVRTVDNHKTRVAHRLGLHGMAEVIRYAIRHGVVAG